MIIKRKTKQLIRALTITLIIFSIIYMIALNLFNANKPEKALDLSKEKDVFSMTIINVDQGLSVLLKCGKEYALYDTGNYEKYITHGTSCNNYLKANNISRIKYLFISHYDSDHCGGTEDLLKNVTVKNAILPSYKGDTYTFSNVTELLENNNKINKIYSKQNDKYSLGNATIEILNNTSTDYSDENNYSTVIKITHNECTYLITGDAEYESEKDMCNSVSDNLNCDVYVVGHHGSKSSSSFNFLQHVKPIYSIISVGKDNEYNLPSVSSILKLKLFGSKIWQTKKHGTVTVSDNGSAYCISSESN